MANETKPTQREEMKAIIAEGGSVMYGTGVVKRIINRVEDLPSELELAGDDTAARAKALDSIDARIAALQAERAVAVPASAAVNLVGLQGEPDFETELATSLGAGPANRMAAVNLVGNGFDSGEKIAAATDEELRAVSGVGGGTVAKLRELYPSV